LPVIVTALTPTYGHLNFKKQRCCRLKVDIIRIEFKRANGHLPMIFSFSMSAVLPGCNRVSTPVLAINDSAICTAAVYSSATTAVLTPPENIFSRIPAKAPKLKRQSEFQ